MCDKISYISLHCYVDFSNSSTRTYLHVFLSLWERAHTYVRTHALSYPNSCHTHSLSPSLPPSLTPFLLTHILITLLPLPSHPSPHARIRATSSPPHLTIVVLTHTILTHPHTYSPTPHSPTHIRTHPHHTHPPTYVLTHITYTHTRTYIPFPTSGVKCLLLLWIYFKSWNCGTKSFLATNCCR